MQKIKILKGRIHYVDGINLFLSKKNKLFFSNDNGESWKLFAVLPASYLFKILLNISPFSRLFRLGVHHLSFYKDYCIAIFNKEIFLIKNKVAEKIGDVSGSRPLITTFDSSGNYYYGEYRSNIQKGDINIHCFNINKKNWSIKHTFKDVRHVHGVFFDKYSESIWITTGDSDSESAIWNADKNFKNLKKIKGGNQQFRCVQLIFTKDYIYFGSDDPKNKNFIYKMSRATNIVKKICKVGGPVFYGIKNKGKIFFSTSVEPGKLIRKEAELWCSENGEEWIKIHSLKKDFLSMKYFQYGQILFPSKIKNNNFLFFTGFATKKHNATHIVKTDQYS